MIPYRMMVLLSFTGGLLAIALAIVCHPALIPFVDQFASPTPLVDLVREQTRCEQLETEVSTSYQRLLERRRIIRAVVDRQLTLIEGAARLLPYEAEMPDFYASVMQRVHGGRTPEENICRYLIHQVKVMCEQDPERCAILVRDLQEELREHVARNGRIVLPNVGASV